MCILYIKQECIPVGCVPAARRPYSGICFPGGGLPGQGGVLPGPGGGLPGRGVLPGLGGGVSLAGGFSLVRGVLPGPGGSARSVGVLPGPGGSAYSVGGSPWQTPPVNRMTDRCKNITLATTSLRPVIIDTCKSRELNSASRSVRCYC